MNGWRVVLVSPYAPSIAAFRGSLIRALLERGAKVYVAAPDYTEKTRAIVEELGAEPLDYILNRTGLNPFQDLMSFLALRAMFLRLEPELVISYNPKAVIYGTLAAWSAGVPWRVALIEGLGYAFTDHGQSSLKRSFVRTALKTLYKLALARSHKAFFLNPDDVSLFTEAKLVEPSKTILLGGIGVPLEEWPPAPPHLNPFTFTLIARLLAEKGVREFAEAARMVKAKHPEARFLLIGPLDTNPGAIPEAEVRGWVEEGILEWVPWTEDVRPYLRRTSVYVLPSYYREGVPRSTQEAMAMARPVITTDAPGCRETVEHEVNGFLVPPRDPGALAEAMEVFLREPGLVEKMGRESRRMAEERFDAHKQAERLIKALIGSSFAHF